jgi:hypothetical protein
MIKRLREVAVYRFSRACADYHPCSSATLVSSSARRIGSIQLANITALAQARQVREGLGWADRI